MSLRLSKYLLSPGPSYIRNQLQNVLGFHSTATVAAAQKGRPSTRSKGRSNPKGLPRTQFRSSSRTRLVKDLKPKDSIGKYEVAKRVPSKLDADKGSRNIPEKDSKPLEPHVVAAEQKASIEALLDEEFDRSVSQTNESLPNSFSSPPLLPTLVQSMADVLGADATPTPIQALALKHLFSISKSPETWKQFLLASETGSGKSIAYLLPLLQYLKQTEATAANLPSRLAVNPRALVLAPTHELTRQLSVFAKSFVHHTKLRVLCASRANVRSTTNSRAGASGTARHMKHVMETLGQDSGAHGQLDVQPQTMSGGRPIDLLVSTPVKALEMVRGWGWDKVGKAEFEREGRGPFRAGKPEMGLKRIECVVVDEADILFDPDFRETTLNLLSDISAARGHHIVPDAKPIDYPFHLILTSATIPNSLSTYLNTYHPALTRLASPHLHRLPATLHTEHVGYTGGNRFADIEKRLRRVWAEDALRGPSASTGRLNRSRVLVFCNRSVAVDALGEFLTTHGIPNVTLTSAGSSRARGSNRHLAGFLKGSEDSADIDAKDGPHVLITTSLLSRGLDFTPSLQHVFIVDSPRNMIDFLHRAGRSGRAGQQGKVVVFGKLKGRGSGTDMAVKNKVRALVRR